MFNIFNALSSDVAVGFCSGSVSRCVNTSSQRAVKVLFLGSGPCKGNHVSINVSNRVYFRLLFHREWSIANMGLKECDYVFVPLNASKHWTDFSQWLLAVGEDGSIERVLDEELKSTALELKGVNVATTSIQCPKQNLGPLRSLGITLPYMVFLVKDMGQPCSFEVQVLDNKNARRRFRASTFQVCIYSYC